MTNLNALRLIQIAMCWSGQIGLSCVLLISGGTVLAQTALPQFPIQISQLTAQDYFNRGFQRIKRRDYQGAIADFNQAIKIDPKFALAYTGRGGVKFNLEDYQGAIADLNQAIKIDPNLAVAYAGRGSAKLDLEDYQGAIADFNQAIKIDPSLAIAYNGRGSAKLNLEDSQGAIVDHNQAIKIDPNLALAYTGRGRAKGRLGDYQGAIVDHNQAIKIDPNLATAYNGRGVAKGRLGDYQGAIADHNQAVKLEPNWAALYAYRSEGFTLLGKLPEALQDAEQAIRLEPKFHYGYVIRGAAHVSAGNFAAAQTDLEQALRLNPKEGFIYYWRGLLALKQGKYEQAISDYEQGVRLTPTVAAKGYENYSLTARRQLNAKVATPAPPVTAPESLPNSPKQPAPNPVATSTSNVYKTAQATTLLIEGQNSGSGVLFSKSANTYYLLTAKHVVATPDEYRIVTPSGKTYAVDYAQIVKLTNSDLAVVPFTSSETLSLAQFGNSQALNQGDEIYISGWPVVDEAITKPSHLVTPGVVVGIRNENKDGYELFYNNSTGPGMSGGPIFNRAGQMIGIHGRASGNPVSGKVGINLGVPVHLFLQQASQAGLNLQRLGLRVQ
jgi:tetratricopeptide (TPR) repeat protein